MITIKSAGGYEKLEYVDLPESGYTEGANIKMDGIPHGDCVVVETHASGVNYADVCIRWGLYASAKEYVGWPITPGFEFSGIVSEVGGNVKDVQVGDKVAGISLFGAYSTRVLVPAVQVRKIPENTSMEQAAGCLCVGLTAWYASQELCHLRRGDAVLVHSAAGGVGSMLVQMLRNTGCRVVGVVGRTEKVDFLKELGCDHIIDKSKEDLWSVAKEHSSSGYKAIFDANGADSLKNSYNHLSAGGRLICYGSHTLLPRSTDGGTGKISWTDWLKIGWKYKSSPTFDPMEMISSNRAVLGFNLSFMFAEREMSALALDQLFEWMKNGSIRVARVQEYTLRGAGAAHKDLESGCTVGKLIMLSHEAELEMEDNKL